MRPKNAPKFSLRHAWPAIAGQIDIRAIRIEPEGALQGKDFVGKALAGAPLTLAGGKSLEAFYMNRKS